MAKKQLRPLWIFYLLVLFVFAFFIWWTILLLQLNEEIYNQSPAILEEKYQRRMWMIISEGAVFLLLLLAGAWRIHLSFKKELHLSRQQKNFLLSVTHELKSPLASIKLALQTLLHRPVEKEHQKKLTNNALNDTERLETLVENILFAAKIENRAYQFQREQVYFSALVNDIFDQYQEIYGSQRNFERSVDENVQVQGDRWALAALISNLIENAVKYSGEGGKIMVALKQKGRKAVFMVADTGKGIADVEKDKIFQKFYRSGDENKRKTKGTGLGLFIVREVADVHDASVAVRDNTPEGSIFEVVFY